MINSCDPIEGKNPFAMANVAFALMSFSLFLVRTWSVAKASP